MKYILENRDGNRRKKFLGKGKNSMANSLKFSASNKFRLIHSGLISETMKYFYVYRNYDRNDFLKIHLSDLSFEFCHIISRYPL